MSNYRLLRHPIDRYLDARELHSCFRRGFLQCGTNFIAVISEATYRSIDNLAHKSFILRRKHVWPDRSCLGLLAVHSIAFAGARKLQLRRKFPSKLPHCSCRPRRHVSTPKFLSSSGPFHLIFFVVVDSVLFISFSFRAQLLRTR